MNEENDYYVAELLEQQGGISELSKEETEQVAELQSIYNEVEDSITLTERGKEELSETERKNMALFYAEMIRLGRNQSSERREALLEQFDAYPDTAELNEKIDEHVAELEE